MPDSTRYKTVSLTHEAADLLKKRTLEAKLDSPDRSVSMSDVVLRALRSSTYEEAQSLADSQKPTTGPGVMGNCKHGVPVTADCTACDSTD